MEEKEATLPISALPNFENMTLERMKEVYGYLLKHRGNNQKLVRSYERAIEEKEALTVRGSDFNFWVPGPKKS